ncbi:DUF6456 domain-containing protein [Xanthobacter sp. TB0139]|uniref:DUF6456 domain-containing protein n=1 Tax=Xanthobacter sp. TB0139 TaxID=3459178 RepID=UPI0040393F3C
MTRTSPSTPKASSRRVRTQARRQNGRGESPAVQRNTAESPLVWLARRKGRDGRAMVDEVQLAAGERLRLDFTRAGLTPRITSRWSPTPGGGGGPEDFTDMVLAAKQRVTQALEAVGPELSGVLLDVCCFLKGLELVEGEHGWPARTAKVVLCLALDRLAAHYGWSTSATGRARARMQTWHAPVSAASPEDEPAGGEA